MTENKPYHIYHFNWRGIFQAFWDTSPQEDVGCLLIPLLLIQILLLVPYLLFSHLKITPTGFEVRDWPFFRFKFSWDDVSTIERYGKPGFFSYDYLTLKDPSDPNNEKRKKTFYIDWRRRIPLSGFRSWPNGRLAQDLEKHIPHIMAEWQEKNT